AGTHPRNQLDIYNILLYNYSIMISAMPEAAESWAAAHPEVMEGIGECRMAGLDVSVFSSQRSMMGAVACGIPMQRAPRDVDLRTSDFWGAVDVLGAEVEEGRRIS